MKVRIIVEMDVEASNSALKGKTFLEVKESILNESKDTTFMKIISVEEV